MFSKFHVRGVIAALIVSATAVPAFAADNSASAKAWVERYYAHPIKGEAGVYDASMVALMRKDRKLAHGEVGALDSDPMCQCQDDTGMKVEVVDAHATGKSAVVHVRLIFTEEKPPLTIPVELDLTAVGKSWRVHDVKSKNTPSLRAYMIKHMGGK
jgi:hypothetical protein